MKHKVCWRAKGINRIPFRCFDIFTDGGGRTPPESKGVRWGIKSLVKVSVRRETRNIWRKMKRGIAARRPFQCSVVSNFSHEVGHPLCICPFSTPSQLLRPQHSTLMHCSYKISCFCEVITVFQDFSSLLPLFQCSIWVQGGAQESS